jgi:hypothetical protein
LKVCSALTPHFNAEVWRSVGETNERRVGRLNSDVLLLENQQGKGSEWLKGFHEAHFR